MLPLLLLAPLRAGAQEQCGRSLATAPNNQSMLNAARLSSGVTLFAWTDVRDAPYSSVYVHMVDSSGQLTEEWPVNGLDIGPPASGVSGNPPLMATLSDTLMFIAWRQQGNPVPIYLAEARWSPDRQGRAPLMTTRLATMLPANSGLPVAMIRQDETHALFLSKSANSPTQALISSISALDVTDADWPASGVVISDTIHVSARDMVSDGSGGCYVLVTRLPQCQPFTPCDADLRLHHILSTGVLDPSWPSNGVLISDKPAWNLSGRLASDRAGGAYVAWYQMVGDPAVGDSLRVWAQHIDASGLPHAGWVTGGKQLLYADDTLQELADLDVLSTGDLVVLFEVAGFRPVLACWTSDGSLRAGWPTLGRVLIGLQGIAYDSDAHELLVAPADQILAVWTEFVTIGANAVAGTAVDPDGQVLPTWPSNGIRFCEGANQLVGPVVTLGSNGTFVLAWEDLTGDGADLRFDRYHLVSGAVPTLPAGRFGTPRLRDRWLEAVCQFDSTPGAGLLTHRSLDSQPFVPLSAPSVEGATTVRVVDRIPDSVSLARYYLADSSHSLTDTLEVKFLLPLEELLVRAESPQSAGALKVRVQNPSGEVRAELFDVGGRLISLATATAPAPSALSPIEVRFPGHHTGLYWVRVRDSLGRVGLVRIIAMR